MKDENIPLKNEQKQLLEDNWCKIEKITNFLWREKFQEKYRFIGLGRNDFESLVGLAVTKAIRTYQIDMSGLNTYITMVIINKANTEIRDFNREKRKAVICCESLNKTIISDNDSLTLEELLFDKEIKTVDEVIEKDMIEEILKCLRNNKEKDIIKYTIFGYSDIQIAKKIYRDVKYVKRVKDIIKNRMEIIRISKILDLRGGNVL